MKQTHVAKKVANIYWGRDGKGLTQWGSNASRDFNRSDLLLSKFHKGAFKSFNFTFHESEENTLINKLFKINNVAMMREIVSSALKQYFHSLRFTFSSLHSIYEYKLWFSIIFIDDSSHYARRSSAQQRRCWHALNIHSDMCSFKSFPISFFMLISFLFRLSQDSSFLCGKQACNQEQIKEGKMFEVNFTPRIACGLRRRGREKFDFEIKFNWTFNGCSFSLYKKNNSP